MFLKQHRIRLVVLAFGVGVGGGAILVRALSRLDWPKISATLETGGVWPWMPLAVLFCLLGYWIRGLRCRRLVSHESEILSGTATNIVVSGYATNNIVPLRLGELVRAYFLRERTGIPFVQTLTVTLLERLFDGWVIVSLFYGVAWLAGTGEWSYELARIALAVLGVVTLGVMTAVAFSLQIAGAGAFREGEIQGALRPRIGRFLLLVRNGLAYVRRPADALVIALLSVLVWSAELGMFVMVSRSVGLDVAWFYLPLTMATTYLGILVPSTAGFIGTFHGACVHALTDQGISAATAGGYATLVHATFFIPITLWGVVVLGGYAAGAGRVWRETRSARGAAPERMDSEIPIVIVGPERIVALEKEPGRLVQAITHAIVSNGNPGPDRDALLETARLVQGQLNSMPALLRVLFAIALTGFRVIVRLRYGKGFCNLAPEKQQSIVESWAWGRIQLRRQMFRLLRSTCLLAYYEEIEEERIGMDGAQPEEAVR